MNTLDWQLAEEAFQRASDADPEARAAILSGLTAEVRARVERLLRVETAECKITRVVGAAATLVTSPATFVGPWRLERPLGEGGMGTVWLARRADDKFEKMAAVKFVRSAMDSPALRARFDRERRILARLEHPNIARVIDAGETEQGVPYLVMEYVEGPGIVDYCSQRNAGLRERLGLFLQVCRAVRYLHEQLVVHRDLKPGNILVDSTGAPRLLDFGLARLLEPDPSLDGARTLVRMLTPAYASPEQFRGEPTGAATDVYGLGAILYELLAGSPAFNFSSSPPADAERTVLAGITQRPSTRNLALRRQLEGDLDNIVMKAMRPDPAERYPTAQALAEDMECFLAGRPVSARDYSAPERAWKFVRRHRLAAAAAAAILASVATGALLVRRASTRADRERVTATAERSRATVNQTAAVEARSVAEKRYTDELADLAQSIESLWSMHGLPGNSREMAAGLRKAADSLERLAKANPADAAVHFLLGSAWHKLGHIAARDEGGPERIRAGLALMHDAHRELEAALPRTGEPDLPLAAELVETLTDLGHVVDSQSSDPRAADVYYDQGMRLAQAALRLHPDDPRARGMMSGLVACRTVARVQRDPLKVTVEEAARNRRLVEAATRRHAKSPERIAEMADVVSAEGHVLRSLGRHEEALERYEEARRWREKEIALLPLDVGALRSLAVTLSYLVGEYRNTQGALSPRIEEASRKMVEVGERLAADPTYREGQFDLAMGLARLGGYLYNRGDHPGAVENLTRCVAILGRLIQENDPRHVLHTNFVSAQVTLGDALTRLGRESEAAAGWSAAWRESETLMRSTPADAFVFQYAGRTAIRLSRYYAQQHPEEAPPWAERAAALQEKAATLTPDPVYRANAAQMMGDAALVLERAGDRAAALKMAARSIAAAAPLTEAQLSGWPAADRDRVKVLAESPR